MNRSCSWLEIEVPIDDERPGRSSTFWPVFVCGIIATLAAGVAFSESPLGEQPSVRSYKDSARTCVIATVGGAGRLARESLERARRIQLDVAAPVTTPMP